MKENVALKVKGIGLKGRLRLRKTLKPLQIRVIHFVDGNWPGLISLLNLCIFQHCRLKTLKYRNAEINSA